LETITRKNRLERIVALLNHIAREMTVLFVMHYPTQKYLERFGFTKLLHSNIMRLDMLNYSDFVTLEKAAHIVLTDGVYRRSVHISTNHALFFETVPSGQRG
jgi:UDP-N-acetylglucosamine 2-epimerase